MKEIVTYEFEDIEEVIKHLEMIRTYICYRMNDRNLSDEIKIKELISDILEEFDDNIQ